MSGYAAHRELIRERIQDFAGRGWVFAQLEAWFGDPGRARVFGIVGGPGTGKSAIAARLAEASFNPDAPIAGCPSLVAGCLDHVHFCRAGSDAPR